MQLITKKEFANKLIKHISQNNIVKFREPIDPIDMSIDSQWSSLLQSQNDDKAVNNVDCPIESDYIKET